jgi:hypothetical protein
LLRLGSTLTSGLSPKSSDLSHVFPVFTDSHATFTTSFTSFLRGKLMRVAALVRDLAPFTGDLTLLLSVHSGESPQSLRAFLFSLCHTASSFKANLA